MSQILPNVSNMDPEESRKESRGVNAIKSNNRITIHMCNDADGTHIIDWLDIGKEKRQNNLDISEPSDKVETLYRLQRISWMDGPLLDNYLIKIWFPDVRKRTSSKFCDALRQR